MSTPSHLQGSKRRSRLDHNDDGRPGYERVLFYDTDALDEGLYNLAVIVTPPGQMPISAGISLSPAEVARVVASMADWLASQAARATEETDA